MWSGGERMMNDDMKFIKKKIGQSFLFREGSTFKEIGGTFAIFLMLIFGFMIWGGMQLEKRWNPCYEMPNSVECATWNELDGESTYALDGVPNRMNGHEPFGKKMMMDCYSGIDLYGLCGMYVTP